VRAQFFDEQRQFVVVKARGLAIENALKVVQLVKENIGDIHSQTRLYVLSDSKGTKVVDLQLHPKRAADYRRVMDDEILDWQQYTHAKYTERMKMVPAVEVILSRH
jgi:hypothetical protein